MNVFLVLSTSMLHKKHLYQIHLNFRWSVFIPSKHSNISFSDFFFGEVKTKKLIFQINSNLVLVKMQD